MAVAIENIFDQKGLMAWVCLSVCLSHLYYSVLTSKVNKGNQPERELEAEAKQVLRTSLYIQSTLKCNLYTYGILHFTDMSSEAVIMY
jgi:hypothetical protein